MKATAILIKKILEHPPYSWFPSSSLVIKIMIKSAQIKPNELVLDIGAGDGRIALAAHKLGAIVEVIEINPIFQQILWQRGFKIVGTDFKLTDPHHLYQKIITNPPFSFNPQERGVDLDIIRRAFDLFLAPKGRLVSIVSASHKHSRCSKAQAFRGWMEQVDAQLIKLPLEAFWGTLRPVTVETWLLIVDKN
jgi:predicted RNA methylase